MWHWEVVFRNKFGDIKVVKSTNAFNTEQEARENHQDNVANIDRVLREQECVLLYDEQVIFIP